MAGFDDALRGYGYPVHKRDGFRCRYCELNFRGYAATPVRARRRTWILLRDVSNPAPVGGLGVRYPTAFVAQSPR